jgi:hypothetical protein
VHQQAFDCLWGGAMPARLILFALVLAVSSRPQKQEKPNSSRSAGFSARFRPVMSIYMQYLGPGWIKWGKIDIWEVVLTVIRGDKFFCAKKIQPGPRYHPFEHFFSIMWDMKVPWWTAILHAKLMGQNALY